MPSERQWQAARARMQLYAALRAHFAAAGYLEVETPTLVPTPGLEPHIDPFEAKFIPQTGVGARRSLWLHTSPEYAMKRLLADPGCPPLFFLGKVFRNGEVSEHHNPEFTLLEYYRPNADYRDIMVDLEQLLAACSQALGKKTLLSRAPYERLTVQEALLRHTGIDWKAHLDVESFRREVELRGVRVSSDATWDDVFFHLFLSKVEPHLGQEQPVFLIEYPASMASLSRLKPDDPAVAERVELYAAGLELGNGFSELTDARQQRERLEEEQRFRKSQGRPVFALDEKFLEAVGRMPPAGGIAVGMDRILMLLLNEERIDDVLLFPAREFV